MRNFYYACLILITLTVSAQAQQVAPSIEWQKCLGGTGDDRPEVMIRTADNGFLIIGFTSSNNDGDVTGYRGGTTDAWVVKLSAEGNLLWQKTFGGSGNEYFRSVVATSDGNYVCAGSTTSNDGDVSGNHGNGDMWVVKIDPSGNLLWQKCLGGSQGEGASSIREFSDGTLRAIGSTTSNDGDVSGLHGTVGNWPDIWVVKLNSSGTLLSQRCFGGERQDQGFDIVESDAGHFIISAVVYSDDGDFGTHSGNPPPVDVIKINSANTMVWKIGSQRTNSRYLSRKGNEVFVSTSFVNCYPMAPNEGLSVSYFTDNPSTTIAPSVNGMHSIAYCASGPGQPPASSITVRGSRSISIYNELNNTVAGTGNGNPDNFPGYHGIWDGYLANFTKGNSLNWRRFVGGTGSDILMGIINVSETEWVAVGYTNSNDGDVSGNHGNYDWWVVKLGKTNIIKGSVFYDYNSNGVKDTGEPGVDNVQVTSSKAGATITGTTTGGLFANTVDTGTYTTTLASPDPNYIVVPASRVSTFSTWNNVDSLSFALQPIPVRDYTVRIFSIMLIRPNADLPYNLSFSNVGTDTLINKNVTFIKDPRLNFISSTPAPIAIHGDTLTWTIDTLLPRTSAGIPLNFFALGPPVLNKGDIIHLSAFIDSTGDIHPADNKWNMSITVTGDPAPYSMPADPVITGLQQEYCNNQGIQKFKVTNMPNPARGTASTVKLDSNLLTIAAVSMFSFNVDTLAAGQHTILVIYSNPGYSKTGTFTFMVTATIMPDVNITASVTQVTNQTTPVVVKAVNAAGGGKDPLYTFAWDRNFTNIIQAESVKDSATIQSGSLAIGDNWIYVRMKTSSACATAQTNTDSIKIRRDQTTGLVDIDYPRQVINVYPNPYVSQFTINGLSSAKQYIITLTDLQGRQLYTKKISNQTTIVLPAIPGSNGMYWLTVYDATRRKQIGSVQLIKQ
jgi:hypothetical protein